LDKPWFEIELLPIKRVTPPVSVTPLDRMSPPLGLAVMVKFVVWPMAILVDAKYAGTIASASIRLVKRTWFRR
jgi:hypothetical protein